MSKVTLGIDVAKLKLDVALKTADKTHVKQFENSPAGFRALQAWLGSFSLPSVHACLEATGTYGDAVSFFLHEQGHVVSLVNPLRIKGYAASRLQRNKTDKADARLIAEFCEKENPSPWTPPASSPDSPSGMRARASRWNPAGSGSTRWSSMHRSDG